MKTKREINYDEKLKESMLDARGPSKERLERAAGHAEVGDDLRGGKVYHFLDSPLDRLYGRLVRGARTENQVDRLRVEYAALTKYHRLFVESGMVGSIGSVDPNRTYSPNPSGRTFLAGSERQQNNRDEYRAAVIHLNGHPDWGHKQTIVVDNVVNNETTLEIAGFAVGKESPGWAHAFAEKVLRDAGWRLAIHWGMARGI